MNILRKSWAPKLLIITLSIFFSSTVLASVDISGNLRAPKKESAAQIIEKYLKFDQYTDAMLEINKALATQPNNPEIYVLAAELLKRTGQLAEAEKMGKEALKLDYKNSAAYIKLGYIYMEMASAVPDNSQKQEYLTSAFDHFFIASQYDPSNPLPHVALAESYLINMQQERSRDEILKAQELSFGNAEAYYEIGRYYYQINDYYNAEKYIAKSIDAGRDSYYKAHLELGKILEQKGEIKEAQEKYLAALKLKPDLQEAQDRLDALIKVNYTKNQATISTPKDLFDEVGDDLKYLMKADSFLMLDQFSEARNLYVALLEKNPKNFAALAGLAELYYSKWRGGYTTLNNFTSDALYLMRAEVNKKNEIALLKFQMINEHKIPEKIRQRLINLSITETFDFYDLLNELRAEFLLGNYEECHSKLLRLMGMKLSNYEKFKILKNLIYDNNYYEALIVLQELQKTYYHNEEIEPVEQRIKAKFRVAEEKLKEETIPAYEEVINYFPTYKPVYLHYARKLEKMGNYSEAYKKINIYYKLYHLYPDKDPEVSEGEIQSMIKNLYKNMRKN